MVSENLTKSKFIYPILVLISSLMEKESGDHVCLLSLPRPILYGKFPFDSH